MPAPIAAILFDDAPPGSQAWANLAPLLDLRPAFDLRTGARTTLDRHASDPRLRVASVDAVSFLAGAPASGERFASRAFSQALAEAAPALASPTLMLSARCPLLPEETLALRPGQSIVEARSGDLVAAMLDEAQRQEFFGDAHATVFRDQRAIDRPLLLQRPWDVIRFRDACLAHDLAAMLAGTPHDDSRRFTVDGDESRLRVHPSAHVAPNVVFDTRGGPVIVGEGVEIQASSVVVGPAFLDEHCLIAARTFLKSNTALGPHCKVGGEVGGCVFQGYANKVHDGHLGDSFVGEWANLGAGTTNSNLLNTYDEVITRVSPRHPNERTGIRYLGAIIGDHAKFAINTRIMTGAVVGTGSMIAATQGVMKSLGRFRWVTDDRDSLYRFDKFLDVARTVMARRGVTPTERCVALLRSLHDLERGQEA